MFILRFVTNDIVQPSYSTVSELLRVLVMANYAFWHMSWPQPFRAQTPVLKLTHPPIPVALRLLQLESPQMMYGPHVRLQAVWSPLTQRAEKEPAGPLHKLVIGYGFVRMGLPRSLEGSWVAFSNVILAVGVRVEIYLTSRGKANASDCGEENSDGVHFEQNWWATMKELEDDEHDFDEEKGAFYAFINLSD